MSASIPLYLDAVGYPSDLLPDAGSGQNGVGYWVVGIVIVFAIFVLIGVLQSILKKKRDRDILNGRGKKK